jgi:hypothetical protein
MPQPALHLTLADDSLRRWLLQPHVAPFDVRCRASRVAFLLGALAPDMGYFPGGTIAQPVSDAAHDGGATDVARILLDSRCTRIRAFALGWLSHVLADVRIHPLVNLGAAALLHDEGERDPSDELLLVAHIRVELGLEGCFSRNQCAPSAMAYDVFDGAFLDALTAAVSTGLHVHSEPADLLGALRAIAICAPLCEQLARMIAADIGRESRPCSSEDFLRLPGVRRIASRLLPGTSPLVGFLNPVRPPDWLMHRAEAEVHEFAECFDALVTDGLDGLPNFDLNTGGWTNASVAALTAV